jgi:hypothetical protein
MDSLSVLMRLGSGQLLDDICSALTATASEVVATGKDGTVTVKFKISTKGQGNALVTIDEQVARTSPKEDPKGAIFWAIEGGLFREDPRQQKMEFREVVTKDGELRDVPTASVERITR